MQQLFVGVPATAIAADGTATIPLNTGWPAAGWSKWNAVLTLQKGVVTVLAGSTVIAGPMPATNGGITFGPMLTVSSDQISLRITGGQSGDTVQGSIRGGSSNDPDDLSSVLPVASSTQGAAQNDPSRLLTGQIGDPLVENMTYGVPSSGGVRQIFVGDFNISGYAALLLYGKTPNAAAGTALYVWLSWEDSQGNAIAFTQIDCLSPQFITFFGALGPRVSIWIGNTSALQVNVNSFTVVPFVSMPSDPGRYIPIAFGALPGSFAAAQTPPANSIISFNASVAATTTINLVGTFVWYGAALWTISPVQSGAGGVSTWWAQLQTTDASGNVTFVDVITGQNVGGAGGPRAVFLPAGTPQVNFRNLGAGAITPIITLIAA